MASRVGTRGRGVRDHPVQNPTVPAPGARVARRRIPVRDGGHAAHPTLAHPTPARPRVSLAGLISIQQHRRNDIKNIVDRMKDRAPDSFDKTVVQARIDVVNTLWSEIRATHNEILLREDSAASAYITDNEYGAMQRDYKEALDWLLAVIVNLPSEQDRNPRRRVRENDDEQDDRPAKLPRLDLPTFSGKYEDWDSFADIFTTLVHETPRLADTTKLQYLKSCLQGSAAELVKDVPILGVNYASTWKALRARFYNPRLTVNKLLDCLSSLPFLKKESAVELRSFVNELQRIVRALTNLKAPVAYWDMWLVHTVEVRLDSESRKTWESELIAKDRQLEWILPDEDNDDASRFPKFVDLIAFLDRRAQSLSVVHADRDDKKPVPSTKSHQHQTNNSRRIHHTQQQKSTQKSSKPSLSCQFCSERHPIWKCPGFKAKNATEKRAFVENCTLPLCVNCLGPHNFRKCTSVKYCGTCNRPHHSSLHEHKKEANDTQGSVKVNVAKLPVNACNSSSPTSECSVLLATAQVTVIGPHGKQTRARALLDQGSEATFISESLVQLLGLTRERVQTNLIGVGGCNAGVVKSVASFTMQSQVDLEFKLEVNAFVLPQLTSELPSRNLVELDLSQFASLPLADREFHVSDRVDLLVGADFYVLLLRSGLTTFPSTLLVAQNTALGWVVSGPTKSASSRRAVATYKTSVKALRCAVEEDLSQSIERFWTIEEVPVSAKTLKPEDEACEKLFVEMHTRGKDGRYEVRLPFKSEPPQVAEETRRMAIGSLRHLHKRFARDPKLARAYTDFMNKYIELGHMELVLLSERNNPRAWFFPHHAVVTGDPDDLKTRVFYDASRPTSKGYRFNDFVMTGQALQSDLPLILTGWCKYEYAFTADIVKMFRQIRVARADQDFQRVLWSPSLDEPVQEYRLTTVTYGTACAPYLAIRTLLQLAADEKARFPLGAQCLESETYVDDTFAGADDLATAIRKRDELIGVLKTAGISLDKWSANHPALIPADHQANKSGVNKEIDVDDAVKALGVRWSPVKDCFYFTTLASKFSKGALTKRAVYSDIARLFDPLGWLAPSTVIAEIIMQDVWIDKCEWDENIPADIRKRWQ